MQKGVWSEMKLFCLPYAGGASTVFSTWKPYIDPTIEIHALELPGHGTRMTEPVLTDLHQVADDLYLQASSSLKATESYAIFGHSMGAVLAYELQKRLRMKLNKEPVHVFYSGHFPPHIPEKKVYHQLSDDQLKKVIIAMGGVPEELADNHAVLDFFLPILRADFQLLETYQCDEVDPAACPISIFYGTRDLPSVLFDLDDWDKYTNDDCEFFEFDGDHFFIHQLTNEVVEKINVILKRIGVLEKCTRST
jgi:surfactin synthase thioesterase subunit